MAACVVALAAACAQRCRAAEGDAPAPEPGETLLTAAEAEELLAALPVFKSKECLKARIVCEREDLLGVRREEGELLLDRPVRILRKFPKPPPKFWLLQGTELREYAPANNALYVKDFSAAPRKLKLVQAAYTGDVRVLQELFRLSVFRRGAGSQDDPAAYRFVLTRRAGSSNSLDCESMQARVSEKALFFHEIEYMPRKGKRLLERYNDITVVPRPSDKEFLDMVELPAGVTVKPERIDDVVK